MNKEQFENLYLEIFNEQMNIIENMKNMQARMEELYLLSTEEK